MKRVFSFTAIFSLALLFTSAISIGEMPQDPPRGKKTKKHVKIEKIENGQITKLDTLIEDNNVLIFNGDTISNGKGFSWISDEDFDFDFDMDFDVKQDGKGNVVVLRSGKSGAPKVYEFKTEAGDSLKKMRIKVLDNHEKMMEWHSKMAEDMVFDAPHGPHRMRVISERKKGNVIDLSDPGIISFDKKDLKGGKEKIVIVREKPAPGDEQVHEEVIINGAGATPMLFHGSKPNKPKKVTVIAGDDGVIEITEDDKVWHIDENDKNVHIIEEEGKKIIVKRIKEGDELKLNVEVEEEIETEEKQK